MKENNHLLKLLSIIVGTGTIIASLTGMFYSVGGERFTTKNIYGDPIELYGDGIYAFNSVPTVANRLGADAAGMIAAIVLIIFALMAKKALWARIIQSSTVLYLTYYSAALVFGITMNRLYLLYVICLGISLFLAFALVSDLFKNMTVPESLKKERLTGTGVFLIMEGVIPALLWGSMIIPALLHNSYSSLLGIQTTEVTYGLDLSITCPAYMICGIWLLKKKDLGYKAAPLLLNMMIGISILVIFQRFYWGKLGLQIPIGAMIGFILSFVFLGAISLLLVIKLLKKLNAES